MKNLEEKAHQFLVALLDVYRDEEKRELPVFDKLELGEDLNEDLTAMLVAMAAFVQEVSNWDGDLIDFTHALNKLAFQYLMEGKTDNPGLLDQ